VEYLLQTPKQLAAHLRSLRKARGLTQAQLGLRLGVDQSRVAKIERNPTLISVGQLLTLLGALGAQVALSLSENSSNKPTGSHGDAADW
jgi:HTH-type transcriptional regulator / antitoxin HipB